MKRDKPGDNESCSRIEWNSESTRKCLSSECSFCRENCPAYLSFQLDSYSSRGKNRAMAAFMKGELEGGDLADIAYACTMCGQCAEVCLTGGTIFDQIIDLRHQLQLNKMEAPGLREMVEYIREKGTPYGRKDHSWIPDEDRDRMDGKGKFGYFPGCALQAEHPDLASKTITVLRKFGIDTVSISKPCCGYPVLTTGFIDEARSMAREFMSEMKRRKIKTLITSCAGCAAMLRLHYPELTGESVRVMHITEVLSRNTKKIKSMMANPGKGEELFYHDPCDLARKLDILDEPRNVIESLGYILREFRNSGKEAACCGGGGGFARDYPEESSLVAGKRIQEARELGGNRIVTACFNCRRMLRSAASGEFEVVDIIELF